MSDRLFYAYASNDTKTASIGNSGSKFRTGRNIHTSQKDWMLDLQEIRDARPDLLWRKPRLANTKIGEGAGALTWGSHVELLGIFEAQRKSRISRGKGAR
jgi:hypothetical protein